MFKIGDNVRFKGTAYFGIIEGIEKEVLNCNVVINYYYVMVKELGLKRTSESHLELLTKGVKQLIKQYWKAYIEVDDIREKLGMERIN